MTAPQAASGLTGIGSVAIAGLLYTAVADDPVSPWVLIAWIIIALALLWTGGRTAGTGPHAAENATEAREP